MPEVPAPSTRDRILDAASHLFYQEGIRAVGVDTIIEQSGVAKATLYRHFPSKDDLVAAYIARKDERLLTRTRAFIEAMAPSPKDRPLALFDGLAELISNARYRGCAMINAIVETPDASSLVHQAAHASKERMKAYIEGLLTGAGQRHPRETAEKFMILLDGALVTALREGKPDAAFAAKEMASTLLTRTK